ncbi:MAG TPA: hypothetical protein VGM69_15520 [Chloroflexota bacterium]|jgi:hypothetical protein
MFTAAVVALALGFAGLSLLFSDLGPGEGIGERTAITAGFYALAGLLVGVLSPGSWPLVALTAWAAVLLLPVALVNGPPLEVAQLLLATLGAALIGGWLAARLSRRPGV